MDLTDRGPYWTHLVIYRGTFEKYLKFFLIFLRATCQFLTTTHRVILLLFDAYKIRDSLRSDR